jgi:acyl dehydratase
VLFLSSVDSITTNKTYIHEKHLLLGILWEGDLEIHTNKERMSHSAFGERILHGDTITGILFGQLFQTDPISHNSWVIKEYQCSYLRPVYIGDVIKGVFLKIQEEIEDSAVIFKYEGLNQKNEIVTSGNITISLRGE